jgi:hypothetical protein
MDSAGGYDGPVDVVLGEGTALRADVNLYQARDGDGLVGAVHVPPQFEHMFADGDQVTLRTPGESGTFAVTGVVIVGGPKAACFVQVGSEGGWA